jgi:cyclic 2,3-diphosphoglycerate synthetase
VVIVDGEHYPPVVEAALSQLESGGHEIAAAVLVGGTEKLPAGGAAYGRFRVRTGGDPRSALDEAITELRPDAVFDLSDEPVLDYRRRHELAGIALYRRVPYEGADFRFWPPPRPPLSAHPGMAVIGTGKRTGKTAVAGFAARRLKAAGKRPVVVAMGRGGPPEPEVLRGDEVELEPADLVALADSGKHAASDYIEDALLARVPTVGCRRCGGGLAGGVGISNVEAGVRVANSLGGDILILEGSGAAIPPVHADATLLVAPASIPLEYVAGYMGPYRMLLADAVLVTMCEHPFVSSSQISAITSRIRAAWRPAGRPAEDRREIRVARSVFRPTPTRSVEGARAFVATTASESGRESIRSHLEGEHGCRVIGITNRLSDRPQLLRELKAIRKGSADLLLCEIKAAGIDTATRWALNEGLDVVFMDNVPFGIDGDDPGELVDSVAELAQKRWEKNES